MTISYAAAKLNMLILINSKHKNFSHRAEKWKNHKKCRYRLYEYSYIYKPVMYESIYLS